MLVRFILLEYLLTSTVEANCFWKARLHSPCPVFHPRVPQTRMTFVFDERPIKLQRKSFYLCSFHLGSFEKIELVRLHLLLP